ncbi:sigma-54 interaction domain-containing protein [Peribacillus muralis]|uniref:sigma-54 interaction domain-containing protein n=1 Tax=Peribacillus muralis TaxID=264697 RepID=UPI0039B7290B
MPSESFITREVLEAILDTIDEGIHVIDPNGQTIFYNGVAAKHDGMNRSEVLGKPLLEAFPSLNHKSSTLLRVIKSEKPIYNFSQSYVNAHGRIIETLNTTLPINVKGVIVGAIEIAKDYSSVKKLSQRLADLEGSLKTSENPEKKTEIGQMHSFSEILTSDPQFKSLISQGKKAARSSSSVLVYGESGVGKELFVQSIHRDSDRRNEPFIAQNCAALPGSLLESLLFGTAKGSYTGALERKGLFELADGGTLFLDELQSMPIDLQAKLLRVLEDGFIRRIGGARSVQVDVRIIAAMNINPKNAVSENKLRPDLYYRLNVLSYELPPLRERVKDIELLTEYFISIYNTKLEKTIKGIDEETRFFFQKYQWPGNVRELKHTIEYMMNHTEQDIMVLEDLPQLLKKRTSPPEEILPLRKAMLEMETKLITDALLRTNGNVFQASKLLQIPRQTLQYKIRKHI